MLRNEPMKAMSKLVSCVALAACLVAATGTAFAQPIQGSISAYAQASAVNDNTSQAQPPTDTST